MDRRAEALGEAAGRAATRFGERFAARVALARDRERADALAIEARPVAEALLEGLSSAERVDAEANELREAIALASLLGRKAGDLDLTPTGALEVAPALVAAVAGEGHAEASELEPTLRAVCLEGYVAAREERLEERAARRAAEAIPVVELVPRCIVVLPSGLQSAEELERLADDVGRRLLDRDARACLVHAAGLREPDRERASQLFALQATCRMLGVRCVFSGVGPAWREAAEEAHLDLTDLHLAPTLSAGLGAALEACGYELRERPALGGVLRRLVGRKADG